MDDFCSQCSTYEAEMPSAVFYGPLLKKKNFTKAMATRYFLIKGEYMIYYEPGKKDGPPTDPHPKKAIWLKDTSVVPFVRKDKNQFGFLLQTSARIHTFIAPSKEVADDWVKAIEAVNKPRKKEDKKAAAAPKPAAVASPTKAPPPSGAHLAEPSPPELMRSKSRAANKIEDLYEVKEELGSGGFATVKKGVNKATGQPVALKMIRNSVFIKNKERTEEEVQVQMSLNHPNIVQIVEVVTTTKFYVIVMELLSGGELFDRIVSRNSYTEHDAKRVVVKMLQAVKYCHDRSVVHRDLKPENLIFDRPGEDAILKLTDFGFATLYDPKKKLTATCGTPEYVAPEILDEKPYGKAVDMWSSGVILYILLCGFPPFYGDTENELFDRICSAKYKFLSPYWDKVSNEAKDLIRHLLELDPVKRYTAEQALDHKWLKDAFEDLPASVSANQPNLSGALAELRKYNATIKFRKAVLAVIAANKMKKIMKQNK